MRRPPGRRSRGGRDDHPAPAGRPVRPRAAGGRMPETLGHPEHTQERGAEGLFGATERAGIHRTTADGHCAQRRERSRSVRRDGQLKSHGRDEHRPRDPVFPDDLEGGRGLPAVHADHRRGQHGREIEPEAECRYRREWYERRDRVSGFEADRVDRATAGVPDCGFRLHHALGMSGRPGRHRDRDPAVPPLDVTDRRSRPAHHPACRRGRFLAEPVLRHTPVRERLPVGDHHVGCDVVQGHSELRRGWRVD